MSAATPADVATALGRPASSLTEDESAQIQWWLDGIELFITNRLGPVGMLDQAAVRYVEVEAVAAKKRRSGNTESSITVAVDDGSVTRRWDGAVGAEDITDEWWNLLDPNSGREASSTRPGFDPDHARWPTTPYVWTP